MKYKPEEIQAVRKNFIDKESWLVHRKKKSEQKCTECKRLYTDIKDDMIAFISPIGKLNSHLCNDCADKYVELGVIDMDAKRKESKAVKDNLISEISRLLEILGQLRKMNNKYSKYYTAGLEKKENEELEIIISDLNKRVEYKNMVDLIDSSNWELEQYLVDDYDVIMDKKYLKHEGQIVNYFSSDMYDYFDCGRDIIKTRQTLLQKLQINFIKLLLRLK